MIITSITVLGNALFYGARGLGAAVALALVLSCAENETAEFGNDTDTLTTPASTDDDDSSQSSDTETDEEEPFPTDLLPGCTVPAQQIPASEDKPDIEAGPRGDGRYPAAAVSQGNEAIIAWAYNPPDSSTEPWVIQTAPYEPTAGIGARQDPFTPDVAARTPALAARQDVFGLVWRDARWDPDCNSESTQSCRYNLAFATLDTSGLPLVNAEPTQLTYEAHIETPPSLTATENGWLVAGAFEDEIFTLPLDENGEPGRQYAISTEQGVKSGHPLALAGGSQRALIAWIAADEWSLLARPLGETGASSGKTVVIAQGSQVRSLSLVETQSGYLLAWSQSIGADFEAFGRPLDLAGNPTGEARRLTWNSGGVDEVDLAWDGAQAALAFVAPRNGDDTDKCAVDSCNEQIFLRLIDENGAAVSRSARLSADPNPSAAVEIFFDGAGFTAAWETRRQYRQQVYYGRAVCSE